MNEIAIRKFLKKYDKVHSSVNGRNFRSKLRAEHIELLKYPWIIDLGAFYINFNEFNEVSSKFVDQFSCDLESDHPLVTLMEIAFNPYALSCGHIFCDSCACSTASVMIFQGLKAAKPKYKCPVCREVGVYANPIHMIGLDLLLKNKQEHETRNTFQSFV
ncbi:hypothetical protein MKX03_010906 [Papaver bracteatum]|nr:hypothetical protein MKX03_010906 [Papaver bracteatum]